MNTFTAPQPKVQFAVRKFDPTRERVHFEYRLQELFHSPMCTKIVDGDSSEIRVGRISVFKYDHKSKSLFIDEGTLVNHINKRVPKSLDLEGIMTPQRVIAERGKDFWNESIKQVAVYMFDLKDTSAVKRVCCTNNF